MGNIFEDLSGVSVQAFDNPYDALIEGSHNDPVFLTHAFACLTKTDVKQEQIQARYSTHRTIRNGQQKRKLLDPNFTGVILDPILMRLHDRTVDPGYVDPRHCLVFWARPPQKVKDLISKIQQDLLTVAPNLWLMPSDCQHMTAMEVTHSRSAEEIRSLVNTMHPGISQIVDYTFSHRARLVKPLLGYDAAAIALSFVPAAGEALQDGRTLEDDKFTYHHLRRDLYSLCQDAGVKVDSRYTVPSSHLTIGRFVTTKDLSKDGQEIGEPDPAKMKLLVDKIEEVNSWLEAEYWPSSDGSKIKSGGEWIVGEEKGLDNRMGTLWYGGGETIQLGRGF